MTRIPSHSVADAPDASRSLLQEMIQFSPTGQLAEAFASLGLAVFTAYFLNYAATELDLPAGR